jgi:hypothetical protein
VQIVSLNVSLNECLKADQHVSSHAQRAKCSIPTVSKLFLSAPESQRAQRTESPQRAGFS